MPVRVLIAVVVISAGLFTLQELGIGSPSTTADAAPANWPTPGYEASEAPLGTPMPAPGAGGAHDFVAMQDDGDRPVAYDPCRPIHYVIRPDNAPAGGDVVVHEAFAQVSRVTGLRFIFDGATDEVPVERREIFQPERYGDRWAPVLVSWQTEAEYPEFATDLAGMAGSAIVQPPGGPQVFVTGSVALDAAAFAGMLADPATVEWARAIVLHELGHLVGLAHVADAGQLMYPESGAVLDFAPGDLSGLSQLGEGECVPTV